MFRNLPVVIAPGFFTGFWPPSLQNLPNKIRKMGFNVFAPESSFLSAFNIHIQAIILSELVDKALKNSKTKKCNIIGISMGGIVALYYLYELDGAKKVNACITIGTPFNGTSAAYLALLLTPSAWEIVPASPLLVRLSKKPKLPDVKMYNFVGLKDSICPPEKSKYKYAHNKAFWDGHFDLCVGADEDVLHFIELILIAEEPR